MLYNERECNIVNYMGIIAEWYLMHYDNSNEGFSPWWQAHGIVFTLLITCQLRAMISLVKIDLMLCEIEAAASCLALVELDSILRRCRIIMWQKTLNKTIYKHLSVLESSTRCTGYNNTIMNYPGTSAIK